MSTRYQRLVFILLAFAAVARAQGAEPDSAVDAILAPRYAEQYASLEKLPVEDWDREGLRRDTAYFMGYQVAAVAVLYAMPESVTNWTEEDKEGYSMSKWWNNVTDPQIDSDDFYLNYLIHPYWGGAYFVRGRERGLNNTQAFWYSALLSALFEFGAEALAEEPSYQDLVATPVLGSMVGVWFMEVRENVHERAADRGYRTAGDKLLLGVTDPLGFLNQHVDRLFGRDVDVTLTPYMAVPPPEPTSRRRSVSSEELAVGLSFRVAW